VDGGEVVRGTARTRDFPVPCPACGVPTGKVHGYHGRTVADVPVDGRRGRGPCPGAASGLPGAGLPAADLPRADPRAAGAPSAPHHTPDQPIVAGGYGVMRPRPPASPRSWPCPSPTPLPCACCGAHLYRRSAFRGWLRPCVAATAAPAVIIPTGKRKGQSPSVASIYRALAEHEKAQAYPEAIAQARTDFAALQNADVPRPRPDAEITSARP
jgi:hypothetical protein